MTSLEKRASDNKQEEVMLEDRIWTTYFLNSSVVVVTQVEVADNNSSISILEDLVVMREVLSVINNSSNNFKTFLKIRT